MQSVGAVANLANGSGSAANTVGAVTETAVNFIPGVGPLLSGVAGNIASAVTRFLGGSPRVPFGREANDAAPHRQEGYLDMTAFAQDNGNEYARWALLNNCTVEDIEGANGYNRRMSGNSWENVVSWWRTHPETLESDLRGFFAANPRFKGAGISAVIRSSSAPLPSYQPGAAPLSTSQLYASLAGGAMGGPFVFPGGGNGALNFDAVPSTPQPLALTAGDLLKAALNGAKNGVTDKFMDTPAGRDAQDKGAIEFFKNRWYIPLGLVVVITGLVVALFTRRR